MLNILLLITLYITSGCVLSITIGNSFTDRPDVVVIHSSVYTRCRSLGRIKWCSDNESYGPANANEDASGLSTQSSTPRTPCGFNPGLWKYAMVYF
jgi:hypothetical protein